MKRIKRIAGLALAAAAVSALTLGLTTAAQASAQQPESKTPKPTIVLVHGAWGDSSSWDGVISRLQRDGYTVDVPPNPLLGPTYDSAFIRDPAHHLRAHHPGRPLLRRRRHHERRHR